MAQTPARLSMVSIITQGVPEARIRSNHGWRSTLVYSRPSTAAQQVVDKLILALTIVAGVAQQQHAAAAEGFLLQRPRRGGEERVGNIRHHQPVGLRAAGGQRPRDVVRPVAGLLDRRQHAQPGGFRHRARAVVDHIADHGDGGARYAGHVGAGNASRGVIIHIEVLFAFSLRGILRQVEIAAAGFGSKEGGD